ncbi:MAG: hypothetical protein A2Z16_16680 [Chloroflexi bacterium RBG_16_54_18]|nr:MAG: hypothetical protein A2Z16_16680 [Chloroflexi bacterium RBG_16_54_18]
MPGEVQDIIRWMAAERKALWLWFLTLGSAAMIALVFAPAPLHAIMEQERAAEAQAAGELSVASEHLARAAALQPSQTQLWELAGRQALAGGDAGKAIEFLERARQELSLEGMLDLGQAYAQNGDLRAAAQIWQAAIHRFEPSVEVLNLLSEANLRSGDYPGARSALESLLVLSPEDAGPHFRLGLLLAAVEPGAAIVHLEEARRLSPELEKQAGRLRAEILAASLEGDPAYTLVSAGRVLAALNEWVLAVEAFSQATLSNPGYAEAWAYLGEARQHRPLDEKQASTQAGLAEIQRALQLDPLSLSAHLFLSIYWSRQGRYDLAQQAITDALRIHPQEAVLYAELGRVLALSGDLAGAAADYLQAAALEPDDATYQRQVVEFSLNYNYQLEALALPAARTALSLSPEDADNLDAMAQVQIRLGQLEAARETLERALKVDAQNAAAHLHYGYLLMLQGDAAAALEQFQLAESLAPGSSMAEQAQRLMEGMLK